MIEDGKLTYPVKGATLIGNGPDALTKVSMIGNDLALDSGVGTCGKDGQSVPVGVGQPTLRIDGLTVGGTRDPTRHHFPKQPRFSPRLARGYRPEAGRSALRKVDSSVHVDPSSISRATHSTTCRARRRRFAGTALAIAVDTTRLTRCVVGDAASVLTKSTIQPCSMARKSPSYYLPTMQKGRCRRPWLNCPSASTFEFSSTMAARIRR